MSWQNDKGYIIAFLGIVAGGLTYYLTQAAFIAVPVGIVLAVVGIIIQRRDGQQAKQEQAVTRQIADTALAQTPAGRQASNLRKLPDTDLTHGFPPRSEG